MAISAAGRVPKVDVVIPALDEEAAIGAVVEGCCDSV